MKKLTLAVISWLLSLAAFAGHMTLLLPAAPTGAAGEVGATRVAADLTPDTLLADTAFCYHAVDYDQNGLYYMMLTLARKGGTAHVQLHMLVEDTMSIAGDNNLLISAVYLVSGQEQYQANGGDFYIGFLRYEPSPSAVGGMLPLYESINTFLFPNHAPLVCDYTGPIAFYTYSAFGTKTPYLPTAEPVGPDDTAIPNPLSASSSRPEKRFVNGRLVIDRSGLRYDFLGRLQ